MLHQNTTPVYVIENTVIAGLSDFQVVKITLPKKKIATSFVKNVGAVSTKTKTTFKRPPHIQEPIKRLALKNEIVVVLVVTTTVKKSTKEEPENLSGIAQNQLLVALQPNICFYTATFNCCNHTTYALHGYFPPPLKSNS